MAVPTAEAPSVLPPDWTIVYARQQQHLHFVEASGHLDGWNEDADLYSEESGNGRVGD